MSNILRTIAKHPLGKRAPLSTLSRYVRWQVGSRLLGMPVVVPFVNEGCLVVEPGMTGATGNIYFGLHEYADMAFVGHALREGELFVDVGANIGSYSVLAAAGPKARVIACEPVPATYRRLRRNIEANHFAHEVVTKQVAASDRVGEVRMTDDLDTMNRVTSDGPGTVVQALPLDVLLANEHPVVMKIDVEGYEPAVIAGAEAVLQNPSLLAVVMEVPGAGPIEALDAKFRSRGFTLHHYDPDARVLRRGAHGSNAIYARMQSDLAERLRTAKPLSVGQLSL
jgi:FkbM family methyltransferase